MIEPTVPLGSDPVLRRLLRWLAIVGIILGVGGVLFMATAVLDRVHNVLVVIIFAILFCYVVYPPIKWLAARKIPVPIAGVIVYAVLGILFIGAIVWLEPAVAAQVQQLTHDYPKLVEQGQRQIADPSSSPLLGRLPAGVRDQIATNAGKAGALLGGAAAGIGSHALDIVSGTTAVIINFALVLGLALLVIGDLASIQAFAIRLVPRRSRAGAISFVADVDRVVGGFVRGQVLLAFVVAAAGTIVLLIVGVPYAILLGLVAGIISIVPIIGAFVAVIPVAIIAFFTVGTVKAIVVIVLFLVITQVQQQVLIPIVVSKSVGVTPLVIFLALLLGSEAFGILGALLSIPIAGILRVTAERLFPADPSSDATFAAARQRAGEPAEATRKAVAP